LGSGGVGGGVLALAVIVNIKLAKSSVIVLLNLMGILSSWVKIKLF
jgi:hypothetical protein